MEYKAGEGIKNFGSDLNMITCYDRAICNFFCTFILFPFFIYLCVLWHWVLLIFVFALCGC